MSTAVNPLLLKRKYAAIIAERQKHPDQSVETFCRAHGIKVWCYYYWRKRLPALAIKSVSREQFVPVNVSPSPSPVYRGNTPRYALRFPSGITLGISGDFDRAHVVELVGILSGAQW
jgi:hypothetical protein